MSSQSPEIRTRSDGTQETYYEAVLRDDKRYVINYELPIRQWNPEEVLEAGHYVVPYAFNLTSKLPASFFQKIGRALAVVQYKVEALLKHEDVSLPPFKCKQRFIVKPEGQQLNTKAEATDTMNFSFCCCGKGSEYAELQVREAELSTRRRCST